MPNCELCGGEGPLTKIRIEGVVMQACGNCAKHGTPIDAPASGFNSSRPSRPYRDPIKKTVGNDDEYVLPNAGALIKAAREKMNMRQIDLSKRLNIAESVIHQIESGNYKPTMDVIKKFEAGLSLKLIGTVSREPVVLDKQMETRAFTIGDMIQNKLKK
jgi:putative transcription factor